MPDEKQQLRIEALSQAVRLSGASSLKGISDIVRDADELYAYLDGGPKVAAARYFQPLIREEHDVVYKGEERQTQKRYLAWYSQQGDWDVIGPKGDHSRMTTDELYELEDVAWAELTPADSV